MFNNRVVVVSTFIAVTLCAPLAVAGDRITSSDVPTQTGSSAGRDEPSVMNFGTVDGIDYWIPANEFTLRDNTPALTYVPGGGRRATGVATPIEAHVNLPEGALIEGYRVYYTDLGGENLAATLMRSFPEDNSFQIVADFDSVGTPGSTSSYVEANHTVRQRDGGANFYIIRVDLPNDPNVYFKAVRIFWRRQVSAAPASATFLDVPVGHSQHRFVEALADAGITAGCGNGNFCPNAPLTRGQMAVFLSVALGLHW